MHNHIYNNFSVLFDFPATLRTPMTRKIVINKKELIRLKVRLMRDSFNLVYQNSTQCR